MPAQTRATNVEEINNDRSVDYGSILLYNSVGDYDNHVGDYDNHCKYSSIHHSTADYDDNDDNDDYNDNNEENASNESDGHRNGSRKLKAQVDQGKIWQIIGHIPREG